MIFSANWFLVTFSDSNYCMKLFEKYMKNTPWPWKKNQQRQNCIIFAILLKNLIVSGYFNADASKFQWFCKKASFCNSTFSGANNANQSLLQATCSTLTNFLSFAQISLTRKKMSALTLSLPFFKCECTPDHHSFKKSALFFQSFFFQISYDFMSFQSWNWSLSFEASHFYLEKSRCYFLRIPKSSSFVYEIFEQLTRKVNYRPKNL